MCKTRTAPVFGRVEHPCSTAADQGWSALPSPAPAPVPLTHRVSHTFALYLWLNMPLLARISSYSAKPALAGAWGVVTYAELDGLIAKARGALAQLKLDRPTAFGLVGEHGPASTAWLLVLAEAGHFVAPLSGNSAEHPAKLALINAQWIVAAEAKEAKLLPRVDEPSAHPLFAQLAAQGAAGLVLFSSGTSGAPKAGWCTHM